MVLRRSNDGARVFTGSGDKTAKVWDLATSQATQVAAHDAPIKDIFWVQEMSCIVRLHAWHAFRSRRVTPRLRQLHAIQSS